MVLSCEQRGEQSQKAPKGFTICEACFQQREDHRTGYIYMYCCSHRPHARPVSVQNTPFFRTGFCLSSSIVNILHLAKNFEVEWVLFGARFVTFQKYSYVPCSFLSGNVVDYARHILSRNETDSSWCGAWRPTRKSRYGRLICREEGRWLAAALHYIAVKLPQLNVTPPSKFVQSTTLFRGYETRIVPLKEGR